MSPGSEYDSDDTVDLDYMHARYHSPLLGRFMSVDPAIESANPRVPQSWNRYSYVSGNPLKYVDPTGEVVSLAGVGDTDIIKLLEDLNEFTGNTYGIDDDKNLVLLAVGEDGSSTATDFLNDLIGANEVYSVMSSNNSSDVLFANNPTGTRDIRIDFADFGFLDFGRVAPATFNTGAQLIHEAAHSSLGLTDPPAGRRFDEIGDTVAFVNRIRMERGLPTRGPVYGGVSRGFFGGKRGINFQGVNPRKPGLVYYVDFPKKLLND